MAIFKKTKKAEKKEVKVVESTVKTTGEKTTGSFARFIVKPRITEKSGVNAETKNVYTFEVRTDATKPTVVKAVKELYKVTPVKVAITRLPAKKVFVRGKWGRKSGVKKAIVYLKKGDKIEFI
jgi:large subunit ribosomal protein L23